MATSDRAYGWRGRSDHDLARGVGERVGERLDFRRAWHDVSTFELGGARASDSRVRGKVRLRQVRSEARIT
jgi:hypothetical protein